MADEFTAARDMVETAIDRAAIEGDVALPRDVFHTFARFGQTLRDDERIMLIRAGRSAGPSYDSDLRRRLLLRREHRYTRSETIVASVIDLNTESRTFRTRLEDGTALSGDYNSEEFELLKRALQPELPLVELDCIVSYDAEERPLRIVSVRDLRMDDAIADTALVDVAPALSLRLQTRLDELRNLGPGWLDGTGRAITPAAQDALRQLLLAVARTPEPRLYPTDDGGVRAEWTVGDTDLSVEVASDGSFYSHALDLSSDHDDEDETAAVDEAVAFIARWLP
jgi:hypothetical protein